MVHKGNDFFQAQAEVNNRIRSGFHIGNIGVCTDEERDLKNSLDMFAKKLDILNTEVKNALEEINGRYIKCKNLSYLSVNRILWVFFS